MALIKIEKRICDFCKKEMRGCCGSLSLKYSLVDYAGNGFPAGLKYDDVCEDCCKNIEKAILKIKPVEIPVTEANR